MVGEVLPDQNSRSVETGFERGNRDIQYVRSLSTGEPLHIPHYDGRSEVRFEPVDVVLKPFP